MRPHRVDVEHLVAPGTPNRPASDWGERGEPDVRGPLCALRGARRPMGHDDRGAFVRRHGLLAAARGDGVAPP
jgi:hypothetical protein